ncbi:TetR/AcrR family transcriptional regulator [Streptomyces sp. NPDC047081]|uniref:TetR/AcrR family transcriptional regulator n=1 Tax=Streptomyces sp. NPDC047081 TaxID=3154706 RepID=UPI0033E0C6A6
MSPAHPGDGIRLRADAVRNHARLLDAAARIVREEGVARLTMEAVAVAAGVGKGTVFRRFGDRKGLMEALLQRSEDGFRATCLLPAPPDAETALERLRAFGVALVRRYADEYELQLAAEPPPQERYRSATRRLYQEWVVANLRAIEPDCDGVLLGRALLGYLEPALISHLTRSQGLPLKRVEDGWLDLVTRLLRLPDSLGARGECGCDTGVDSSSRTREDGLSRSRMRVAATCCSGPDGSPTPGCSSSRTSRASSTC